MMVKNATQYISISIIVMGVIIAFFVIFPINDSQRLSRLVDYDFSKCQVVLLDSGREGMDSSYIFSVKKNDVSDTYVKKHAALAVVLESDKKMGRVILRAPIYNFIDRGAVINIGRDNVGDYLISYDAY